MVQTATRGSAGTLSFTNPVTSGNTVLLIAGMYNNTGAAMSSSAPQLNSATITGTTAVLAVSGNGLLSPVTGSNRVYATAWVLPHITAASQNGLTLTTSGGTVTGMIAIEVSGLGSSPTLQAYDHHEAGSGGASPGADSGLGFDVSTAAGAGLATGFAQIYDQASAGPASPWTSLSPGGGNQPTWAGYRSFSGGSGGAFHWAQAASTGNTQPWAAGEFVITS